MVLAKPSERESYRLIFQSRNYCRQNLKNLFFIAKILTFCLLRKRFLIQILKDWGSRILRWPQLVKGNMKSTY